MRTMLLVLLGLAAGCAFQTHVGTPYVPPEAEIAGPVPDAVLESARFVAPLLTGTGFCSAVLMPEGHVFSDRHCFDAPQHDFSLGIVRLPDATYADVTAVTQDDVRLDVVRLWLDRPFTSSVRLAHALPRPGERVYTVGYGCADMAAFPVLHSGRMGSAIDYSRVLMAMEPPICPGDSGGGAFNADGELFGLVKSAIPGTPVAASTVILP